MNFFFFILIAISFILSFELAYWFYPMTEPCQPFSDIALIETQIHFSKLGKEFTGVYSRFQFNHPGPIQFYWNGFMEWISPFTENTLGKHQFSNWILGKLFLGIGLFYLFLSVGRKDKLFVFFISTLLYIFFYFIGIHELNFTLWNPANTISPVFLLVFAYPFMLEGKIPALILLPWVTQFAFQNHIGVAILIAPLSIYLFYRLFKFKILPRKSFYFYIFYYVLISLILFSPAIYEELTNQPGNITQSVEFILKNGGIKKSLWKTLQFTGSLYLGSYSEFSHSLKISSGLLSGFIFIIVALHKFQEKIWSDYRKLFIYGFIITNYASLGMKGPFIEFGIWFYYPFVFLSYLLLGKWLIEILRIRLGINYYSYKNILLIILLGIFILLFNLDTKPKPICNQEWIRVEDSLVRFLDSGKKNIEFELPFNETHGDMWPSLATVVNRLTQENIPVCVNTEWDFMFNRNLRCERMNHLSYSDYGRILVMVRNKNRSNDVDSCNKNSKDTFLLGDMLLCPMP